MIDKIIISIMLLLFLSTPISSLEDTFHPHQFLEGQLEELDLLPLQHLLEEMNRDLEEYLPSFPIRDFILISFQEGFSFDVKEMVQGLLRYFFREVLGFTYLLGQLLILAVVNAILKNFHGLFEEEGISRVAEGIIFLVLALLSVNAFRLALDSGQEAIKGMIDLMHSLLPVMLSLLVSIGALTSAALLQPLVVIIINSFALLIGNLVFPLLFLAAVLDIADHISGEFSLSRLSGLLKEVGLGTLGLSLTIFTGFMALQGIASSIGDGLTLRTAKYLTGSFIPVVGGMFADALEILVGTSLFLKNAVGLVGLLILFFIVVFPVLKILAISIIFKIAAALIQPICSENLVSALNNLGNSLTLVFAAVASVGIMYFMMLAIVLGAANLTVMLR